VRSVCKGRHLRQWRWGIPVWWSVRSGWRRRIWVGWMRLIRGLSWRIRMIIRRIRRMIGRCLWVIFRLMIRQISIGLRLERNRRQKEPPSSWKSKKKQKTSGWTTSQTWKMKTNTRAEGSIAGYWSRAATVTYPKTSSLNPAQEHTSPWKMHHMNAW